MSIKFSDVLYNIGALIVAIGGPTIIILALSKWLGEIFSKSLLTAFKNKHETELEGIKSKYQKELEASKVELDKAKTIFLRYTEEQFKLYNEIWKVLLFTKKQADELWEKASVEKIPPFSEQIRITEDVVNNNMLLIEDKHYVQLIKLIDNFEKFKFGKITLKELRGISITDIASQGITNTEVKRIIKGNKRTKDQYDQLIFKIGKNFRKQIKGGE